MLASRVVPPLLPRMNSEPVFHFFGPAHLVAILLTIVTPVGLGVTVRMAGSRRIDRAVAAGLAVLLATNYLGYAAYLWWHHLITWTQALPFQLCDWAMVTTTIAL